MTAQYEVWHAPGEWAQLLAPAAEPHLRPMGTGGPPIWRVSLGYLDQWPHPIDRLRDRMPQA